MSLVRESELLSLAREKGFAVPGFFAFNMEYIQQIIEVAQEERSPVVLCQGPEFIQSFGEHVFTNACKTAALHAEVPVALSVDHSFITDDSTIPSLLRDIHLGWGSVMLDASLLPFDENVAMSRELATICKGAGVDSVAALGEVRRFFPQAMQYQGPFEEDFVVPEEIMTKPEYAKLFIEQTKVDTLAISIGQYVRSLWDGEVPPLKKTARLDFKRLEEIKAVVDAHLILHGATHVCEEDLQKAATSGISMIKVASEQALVWSNEIRRYSAENPNVMFPEDVQKSALLAVKESMRHYIRLFRSNNQV